MKERDRLLQGIAQTISDYRIDELPQRTPAHVDQWLRQFDVSVQLGLLRELSHVLQRTYIIDPHVLA
jgi:hypothetical protein